MKENDISQMPVMENGEMVGSITESTVLTYLLENPLNNTEKKVETIMDNAFPVVQEDLSYRQLAKLMDKKVNAVIAKDKAGSLHVLTKYDIIQAV
jgi:cystathionine beta-synthase